MIKTTRTNARGRKRTQPVHRHRSALTHASSLTPERATSYYKRGRRVGVNALLKEEGTDLQKKKLGYE